MGGMNTNMRQRTKKISALILLRGNFNMCFFPSTKAVRLPHDPIQDAKVFPRDIYDKTYNQMEIVVVVFLQEYMKE